MREFYPKYQVNAEMFALTNNQDTKFMHHLPAMRGEEVSDGVIDSEASLCWEQAQNLIAAERGLLLYFSGAAQDVLNEIEQQSEKPGKQSSDK